MADFHLPQTTDWRIHPDRLDESVVMVDGKIVRVITASEEDKIGRAIIEAVRHQSSNLRSRGAVLALGKHYRLERMPNGFYAVRRLTDSVPTLAELNVPASIRRLLLNRELGHIGGVILIVGKPGRGKSFTAAATLCDRLREDVADYALTYENPPEFLMQGFHGSGYLDQNSIPEGEYAGHLSHALRCFPAMGRCMLFVGELLDTDSAAAFCRVGLTGNLCIATGHGDDIITGISRWLSLCGADQSTSIRHSVANALRLVIYQDLAKGPDGKRRPVISALKVTDAAANHIRQGNLHLLSTEIENTQRSMERMMA